jgi:probable HAF family extracellular repeat protein
MGDHGFLTDGTAFTTLDVPGATRTDALGINAAGQIVGLFGDATGSHSFLTSDGVTFTTLDVPGATATDAWGINDRGQIVGTFSDATGVHGFVATRGR